MLKSSTLQFLFDSFKNVISTGIDFISRLFNLRDEIVYLYSDLYSNRRQWLYIYNDMLTMCYSTRCIINIVITRMDNNDDACRKKYGNGSRTDLFRVGFELVLKYTFKIVWRGMVFRYTDTIIILYSEDCGRTHAWGPICIYHSKCSNNIITISVSRYTWIRYKYYSCYTTAF